MWNVPKAAGFGVFGFWFLVNLGVPFSVEAAHIRVSGENRNPDFGGLYHGVAHRAHALWATPSRQRGAYVLGYLVPTPRIWTAQSPRLLGYREEIHKFLVGVGALAIAWGSSDRNDQEQA